VTSDISALLAVTDEVFVIDDDRVVEVRPQGLRVTTLAGVEEAPVSRKVTWSLAAVEKDGFAHFMLKEIHEQPAAVRATLAGRLRPSGICLADAGLGELELAGVRRVLILACGTSYHAGLVGRLAVEDLARLPAEVEIASEFRHRQAVVDAATMVVAVSQSGETLDTIGALEHAKALGTGPTVAVTNVVDSSLARLAGAALYTQAGPEIGVAATKTYLTQVVALQLLTLGLAQARGRLNAGACAELHDALWRLPERLQAALATAEEARRLAEHCKDAAHVFFLGRGPGHPVALEGALKLKETSYIHAEGYPAGELKHGPIALIEAGTMVVAVATRGQAGQKRSSPTWRRSRPVAPPSSCS
jgi:glutamine---fructose-6-phosphate transaminase (isomerizing)